jgi:conjugative transfer region protein TrbK
LKRSVMNLDLLTRTIAVSILASSLPVIVVLATRYTPHLASVSNDKDDATVDPSAAEHKRCKELGLDATSDEACRALWAKDHDQFFGFSRPRQPKQSAPSATVVDHEREAAPGLPNGLDGSNDRPLEPSAGNSEQLR